MPQLHIVGIIPVRMKSSRFPGKPLKPILGVPMVGHIWHRAKMSTSLSEVYIALQEEEEIADYAQSIGAKWVKTKSTHNRASDQTAHAMEKIEEQTGTHIDIVVMIQGDEPMITPEMVDMAVAPFLADKSVGVVNLMAPITTKEEHEDPNCPKVVVDNNCDALYFSREPIPSDKKWDGKDPRPCYKQVCIIPFTREALLRFNSLPQTPLEKVESIDMNRLLEHGYKVRMVLEHEVTQCVDTPQDLERVEQLMQGNRLLKTYAA